MTDALRPEVAAAGQVFSIGVMHSQRGFAYANTEKALIKTLLQIDAAMPGYAARSADAVVALGSRERHKPDYEQLPAAPG